MDTAAMPVCLIDLEYRLDQPCQVPLVNLPLVARGTYAEVSPKTVALRLMEDRRDGMKKIGIILEAEQNASQDMFDFASISSNTKQKIPGQMEIIMKIKGQLFPEIVAKDWTEIRPDVPTSDFSGILMHCEPSFVG